MVRPIPMVGRGRRTPPRGGGGDHRREGRLLREVQGVCSCTNQGLPSPGDGRQWADLDEDANCKTCRRSWGDLISTRAARPKGEETTATAKEIDRLVDSLGFSDFARARWSRPLRVHSDNFDCSVLRTSIENDVCDSFVGREVSQHLYSGARNIDRGSAHNRLSNIRQVFVPTLRRRPNSSALLHNHFNECADSMGRSRRRRSVGSGCTWQWMQAPSHQHALCIDMHMCIDMHCLACMSASVFACTDINHV